MWIVMRLPSNLFAAVMVLERRPGNSMGLILEARALSLNDSLYGLFL